MDESIQERIARRRQQRAMEKVNNLEPATEEIKPIEEEVIPVVEEIKSIAEEIKPIEEDIKFVAEDVKLVEEEYVVKQEPEIVQPTKPEMSPARKSIASDILSRAMEQAATIANVQSLPRAERIAEVAAGDSAVNLLKLLDGMRIGETLFVTRTAANVWEWRLASKVTVVEVAIPQVQTKDYVTTVKGELPQNFYKTLLTTEYQAWDLEWNKKTYEEKLAYADKLGVQYQIHQSGKAKTMIDLTPKVRAAEGIEKYKPEYGTIALRKKAEVNARAGLPW